MISSCVLEAYILPVAGDDGALNDRRGFKTVISLSEAREVPAVIFLNAIT